MTVIKLEREWEIIGHIGGGGFGRVYRATCGTKECALKLVPKSPGAERELLFVDLGEVDNVVPILESGETDTDWAMIMPLADCSLRDWIKTNNVLSLEETIKVLTDVCCALASLQGRVVHRDIKPENILLLNGNWCLADFGIARYAEATTDAATQKYAMTPAYAAPERWRFERATPAADVYAVGAIAYELLAGQCPFPGPGPHNFRQQHLHAQVALLKGVPSSVAAIVDECLYKAPEARPSADNLVARLRRIAVESGSKDKSRLASANLAVVKQRAEEARQQSQARSEEERRQRLLGAAGRSYKEIGQALYKAIAEEATAAHFLPDNGSYIWLAQLGPAKLSLSHVRNCGPDPWNWSEPPAIEVVAYASVTIEFPADRHGYQGRSHSLWFCDTVEPNGFVWYETAFMISPLYRRKSSEVNPFSLPPGEAAAKALWRGVAEYQVAWPFERLERDNLREFVDRWTGWFADAALGKLSHPGSMPERSPGGSWRDR